LLILNVIQKKKAYMNKNCLTLFYKISFTIILFGSLALLFGLCGACNSNFLKHFFFGIVVLQGVFLITLLILDIGIPSITKKDIFPFNILIITLLFSILLASQIDILNEIVEDTTLVKQSTEILIDILGTIVIFIIYLGLSIGLKKQCNWKLYWMN